MVLLLADFDEFDCVLAVEVDAWSAVEGFVCCVLAVLLDVVVGLGAGGLSFVELLSFGWSFERSLDLLIDRSPNCCFNWQSLVRLLVC